MGLQIRLYEVLLALAAHLQPSFITYWQLEVGGRASSLLVGMAPSVKQKPLTPGI
jgi:hypothetical protein